MPVPPDRLAGRPSGSAPPIAQLAAKGVKPTVLGPECRLDNGAMFLPGGVVRTSDDTTHRAGEHFVVWDPPYALSGQVGSYDVHVNSKLTGNSSWFVWDEATGWWSRWDYEPPTPQLTPVEPKKEEPQRVRRTLIHLGPFVRQDGLALADSGFMVIAGNFFSAYQEINLLLLSGDHWTRKDGPRNVLWHSRKGKRQTGYYYVSGWTWLISMTLITSGWSQLVADGSPESGEVGPCQPNRFLDLFTNSYWRWCMLLLGVFFLCAAWPFGLTLLGATVASWITAQWWYWCPYDPARHAERFDRP